MINSDKLTLKRMFSEMRKASSNITNLKVKERTYNKKPFVCGGKINGVNINFTNDYSSHNPVITLKHGLVLEVSSSNNYWVPNGKNMMRNQCLAIDNDNILSHITLRIAKHEFGLYKRKNIENSLLIKMDDKKSLYFELNDDLEFDFDDLPKNIYEWDEEHFLYYSLKGVKK